MSLRVWLPLTKDLRNQGLDDVTVTNNGAIFDVNGKLGGCYRFGTSNSYITVDSTPLKTFTEFSFACWVKIISWNTNYSTIFAAKNNTSVSWNNLIFSLLRDSSSSTLCFNISNGSNYTSNSCRTEALSLNTWYHITCTYKNGQIKLYQDGNIVSTYNTSVVPNFSSIVNLWIGKSNENSYQSNNLLNDVRIYDHCLSPLEVKQISQGLILHYPLNRNGWGNENLLVDTYNWSTLTDTSTVSEGYWYSNGGTAVRGYDNMNNITYCKIWHSDSSSWTRYSRQYITMQPNTYYTVSILCRINTDIAHLSIRNDRNEAITLFATNVELTNKNWEWKFFTAKTHTNTSQEPFVIYAHRNSDGVLSSDTSIDIAMIKLEEGSIATPWCPNSADALATTMGLNDNIEYDTSGYGNNGIKVGTLTYLSDTPKYNISTKFSDNSYIKYKGPESMYQATYAFWVKAASYTSYNMIHGPLNSPAAGTSPWLSVNTESSGAWAYFGGNSPSYTKNSGTALSTNEWHYLTYVWNNGVAQWYVDGEKFGNSVTYTGKTFIQNSIESSIGDSYTGTGWSGAPFTGQLSDFRLYATALSANDIKSFYNNSAYIDNQGNIYGAVYEEV